MSGIFGRADSAKTKRNAQSIVSTFNAARAAGNNVSYATVNAAVDAITSAPLHGGGVFASSQYFVAMNAAEVTAAKNYIADDLNGSATQGTLSVLAVP